MLNRFRDLVKRLELPEEERDIVYRIIDDNNNAVEVTAGQYARWRMLNDVAQRAIVGQDTVENVRVRTTFSIMPEDRNYKPFGTSAFDMVNLDPLLEYSRRYDTWNEAEKGHRDTLDRIRNDNSRARVAEEMAQALTGPAGDVRIAISVDLPAIFDVEARSDDVVRVSTPLLRPDESPIEITVNANGGGFSLSAPIEVSPNNSVLTLSRLRSEQVSRLCGSMGVSLEGVSLTCTADSPSHLAVAIVRLAQAVVCVTSISNERR